jgi:transposase
MRGDRWQVSDELWELMRPLLPEPPLHPKGGHRPRVPDRAAMNAILFVLRTGCTWNALRATEICSSSSAHRCFQEWTAAGVFRAFWKKGLLAYDETKGVDWRWLAMDDAMTKAPLGGEQNRSQSHGPRQTRHQLILLTDGRGIPIGLVVAPANRNGCKRFADTVDSIPIRRPRPRPYHRQGMCLDKGYDFDFIRSLSCLFGFTLHLRTRGEETRALRRSVLCRARCWVVERTHSWMNRFRRILIRWEKSAES